MLEGCLRPEGWANKVYSNHNDKKYVKLKSHHLAPGFDKLDLITAQYYI